MWRVVVYLWTSDGSCRWWRRRLWVKCAACCYPLDVVSCSVGRWSWCTAWCGRVVLRFRNRISRRCPCGALASWCGSICGSEWRSVLRSKCDSFVKKRCWWCLWVRLRWLWRTSWRLCSRMWWQVLLFEIVWIFVCKFESRKSIEIFHREIIVEIFLWKPRVD